MVNFNVETMTNINVQTLKEEDGRLWQTLMSFAFKYSYDKNLNQS
jgi:hypothetical protein